MNFMLQHFSVLILAVFSSFFFLMVRANKSSNKVIAYVYYTFFGAKLIGVQNGIFLVELTKYIRAGCQAKIKMHVILKYKRLPQQQQ